MSYENYLEAYNDFWELKEKYDKKERKAIKTLKKKHPNNIPLVKEELQKFRDRRKCVNCNKVGGTVFEITKTHINTDKYEYEADQVTGIMGGELMCETRNQLSMKKSGSTIKRTSRKNAPVEAGQTQ